MEKAYAEAIYGAVEKGSSEDSVFEALKKHLAATGRMKLLPRIMHELKALIARRTRLSPTVEVSRKEDAQTALSEAKALGIEATDVVVNDTLVSGWRARKEGLLVDRSGKRALIDLYRRITG